MVRRNILLWHFAADTIYYNCANLHENPPKQFPQTQNFNKKSVTLPTSLISILSSHRKTSGPSSVSALNMATRAMSIAAASWSNPAARFWVLRDASTQLKQHDVQSVSTVHKEEYRAHIHWFVSYFWSLLERLLMQSPELFNKKRKAVSLRYISPPSQT